MDEKDDRALGMHCRIARRDFLNGLAVSAGGLLAADPLFAALADRDSAPAQSQDYYPPALTGMRGNHDGSFTYAHALRDGKSWTPAGKPAEVAETYDLVVVGAGISGLSAAYFYRKHNPNARILILDN